MKKKLVVFTGAGISKESGLETFRDKGGVWDNHDLKHLISVDGWKEKPNVALDFYNARRRALLDISPNKAHKLLASLEKYFDVTIITQNIDNLHERAGSSNVIHLHGELSKVCSSYDKETCIETRALDNDIKIGDKASDGSQLRPYITFFGENVTFIKDAMNIIFNAEIFVVIGTSLKVSPANTLTLCSGATHNIVIDPSDVDIPDNYLHIKEPATIGVEMLYNSLCKLLG